MVSSNFCGYRLHGNIFKGETFKNTFYNFPDGEG